MLNKACDFLRTMIYHHQNPRGLDKWERVCRKSMLITCLYSFNRFEIISTKKRIIIRKKTYTKCSGTKGRSPTPTRGPPAILPSAFSPPGYSSTVQKLFPCVPWVLGPAEPPLPGVQGRAGRAAGVRGLQPPRPRPPPSAAAADEPVGKAAHEDKRRPTGPVAEQTAAGLAGYCSRWNVSGLSPGNWAEAAA